MEKYIFHYSLAKVIHISKGVKHDTGKIYQISIFTVAELPNVRVITLDHITEKESSNDSIIVYLKDKYLYRTSIKNLDKILRHLSLFGNNVFISPSSPTGLIRTCLGIMDGIS